METVKAILDPKYEGYSGAFYTYWKSSFETKVQENISAIINGPSAIRSNFLVIKDTLNSERYFIGHVIHGESICHNSLVGGIFYITSTDVGKTIKHRVTFGNAVFGFDARNGSPSHLNMFLCGNVLCYAWNHRDTHHWNITGVFLRENIIKYGFQIMGCSINSKFWDYPVIESQKWLCFHSPTASECYNLNSAKIVEKDVMIDMYRTDYNNGKTRVGFELGKTLEALAKNTYIEEFSIEGYPTRCVRCKEKTSKGIIWYSNTSQSMGSGVCIGCLIRYSKWCSSWICLKLKDFGGGCKGVCGDKVSSPDFVCLQTHLDAEYNVSAESTPVPEEQEQVSILIKD